MKKSKGKIVSLMLALIMMITSFPVFNTTAFAAETGDITVSSTGFTSANYVDGDSVTMFATVRNMGTETIPAGAQVSFYFDGILHQTVRTKKALASAEYENVTATVKRTLIFGSHKITAWANSEKKIAESNYENNVIKQRFVIKDEESANPPELLPANVVINQVYGGGGKGDTPFNYSFIELYNKGDKSESLSKYKLTYLSSRADGDGSTGGEVETLELKGTIPARTSYLIRCNAEETARSVYDISKFDIEWNRVIDNKQYRVSLLKDNSEVDSVTVVDKIATTEVWSEGEPVVDLSKQKSARRVDFADTDSNSADFELIVFNTATVGEIQTYRPRSLADAAWLFEVFPEPEVIPEPEPETPDPNPTMVSPPKSYSYEAETAALTGGANVSTQHKGYSYDGYVQGLSGGAAIGFTHTAQETSEYTVKIRYANGNSDWNTRTANLSVNGGSSSRIDFVTTTSNVENIRESNNYAHWDSWGYVTKTVTLNAGSNTIKIAVDGGTSGQVNIDKIEITRSFTKKITYFAFLKENNPKLTSDIVCDIDSSSLISAKIPNGLNISALKATYTTASNATVKVMDAVQESGVTLNNFTNGHYYAVSDGAGSVTYTVMLMPLEDTKNPNVFINFDASVTQSQKDILLNATNAAEKDVKIPCVFSLELGSQSAFLNANDTKFTTLDRVGATINIRGNSTLRQPKKSWKIKLDNKSKVLDMASSKHWVLLASFDDKTFLRQYMGYELGGILNNTDFTPHTKFSNVFFDGKYMGLYLIVEQPKIDSDRVNGDYLLEYNQRRDEIADLKFEININGQSYPFEYKDPDDLEVLTPDVKNSIRSTMQTAIQSLYNAGNRQYEQYIDVDSFVDWYLTMEIMKNLDAKDYSSIYFHISEGKVFMGPVWDFDISSGNVDYREECRKTDGWWIKGGLFWNNLLSEPNFKAKVKARYAEFRNQYPDFASKITEGGSFLADSAKDNYEKWDILSLYTWPEPNINHNYASYITEFRSWMNARLTWMDNNINNI